MREGGQRACPTCRAPMGEGRSLLGKVLVENMKHQCECCKKMMPFKTLKQHQMECNYRRVVCPGGEVGLGLSKVLKKVLKKVNLLKKVLKKVNLLKKALKKALKKVNLLKKALKKALKKVNLLKKGLKKEQPVKKVNSRKCIHSKK